MEIPARVNIKQPWKQVTSVISYELRLVVAAVANGLQSWSDLLRLTQSLIYLGRSCNSSQVLPIGNGLGKG